MRRTEKTQVTEAQRQEVSRRLYESQKEQKRATIADQNRMMKPVFDAVAQEADGVESKKQIRY
ncbi:MAG: hypothetical protein ACRBDI_02845 [Alphaproteobacteria bacterium]